SEEHTSELQSLTNLVCRLLLEKKLYGSVHLPPILPHNVILYAFLRKAHTVLAYLLFLMFIAHLGAILFHTLIVLDRNLLRVDPWNIRAREKDSLTGAGGKSGDTSDEQL